MDARAGERPELERRAARAPASEKGILTLSLSKGEEHNEDVKVLREVIEVLTDPKSKHFARYCKLLEEIAPRYNKENPESVVEFVLRNINKHQIVIINSKGNKQSVSDLFRPTSLFSFGAGGNIISRGVTFENLLSMYFTRSVKGKFAQDTYIQRARMFGSRNKYKEYFQLWIPSELIESWNKCFMFHKLAVEAIKSGKGAPVWLADHKTTPTSSASIDRSSVDFEGGEMSFGTFRMEGSDAEKIIERADVNDIDKLQMLHAALPGELFPDYVLDYISEDARLSDGSICFHPASEFGGKSKTYTDDEIRQIRRKKNIFANSEFSRGPRPSARHHLKIYFNQYGDARLFYKINGHSVKFIQNRR